MPRVHPLEFQRDIRLAARPVTDCPKMLHDQPVVAFLEAGDGCEADVAAGPRRSSDYTPQGTRTRTTKP